MISQFVDKIGHLQIISSPLVSVYGFCFYFFYFFHARWSSAPQQFKTLNDTLIAVTWCWWCETPSIYLFLALSKMFLLRCSYPIDALVKKSNCHSHDSIASAFGVYFIFFFRLPELCYCARWIGQEWGAERISKDGSWNWIRQGKNLTLEVNYRIC